MKKAVTLAVMMLILWTSPALARDTMIVIDNAVIPLKTANINGQIYTPIRTTGDALNVDVQWVNNWIDIKSVKRPAITGGDEKSKAVVIKALDLLQQKDPVGYEIVCRNTKGIEVSDSALRSSNGGVILGRMKEDAILLSPILFNKSLEFVAATLVHESTHLCNAKYGLDIPGDENMAYLHGINTLQILGASQQEIAEAEAGRQLAVK